MGYSRLKMGCDRNDWGAGR